MTKTIRVAVVFLLIVLCGLSLTCNADSASQQTSSTDASVIITRARYYLNEPSEVYWDDAELLVWVNYGTTDIVARTQCLEAVETEQLVENQLSYGLDSSFIAIRTVIYDQGSGVEKGLLRGNLQSVGHVEAVGEPVYWLQEQNNVVVYPRPDSSHSGSGHDIDVYMIEYPAAIESSDDVLVPAYYDRALTLYVVAQAFYKKGQFSKAGRFMAEYLAELDRYRKDYVVVPKEPVEVIK